MKRKLYLLINLIVISASLIFFLRILYNTSFLSLIFSKGYSKYILLAVIGSFIVYSLKFIRLYLILIESRIPFYCFIRMYIKTTFISLLLPYKFGDLFRIYTYGYIVDDYKISFLAILIDRYFDSLAVFLIVFPLTVYYRQNLSLITFIIILFIIAITVTYFLLPSTYKYFNRFFIFNTYSRDGLRMLRLLNYVNVWHSYAITLVRGRAVLLFLISCLSWGGEYIVLVCLSHLTNSVFTTTDFISYLNSIFIGNESVLVNMYVCIGVFIFAASTVLVYGKYYLGKGVI